MTLYTTQHVIQIFILGIVLGFLIGGLLISSLKSGRIRVIILKPRQRKIPSVTTTEYPIVSNKNYKIV